MNTCVVSCDGCYGVRVCLMCHPHFVVYFKHVQVTEMAVSELPGNPNGVWTVKTNAAGLACTSRHFAVVTVKYPLDGI